MSSCNLQLLQHSQQDIAAVLLIYTKICFHCKQLSYACTLPSTLSQQSKEIMQSRVKGYQRCKLHHDLQSWSWLYSSSQQHAAYSPAYCNFTAVSPAIIPQEGQTQTVGARQTQVRIKTSESSKEARSCLIHTQKKRLLSKITSCYPRDENRSCSSSFLPSQRDTNNPHHIKSGLQTLPFYLTEELLCSYQLHKCRLIILAGTTKSTYCN